MTCQFTERRLEKDGMVLSFFFCEEHGKSVDEILINSEGVVVALGAPAVMIFNMIEPDIKQPPKQKPNLSIVR